MVKKPRSAPDPEARARVLQAIRRDMLRDYEKARQIWEKLHLVEAGFLKARDELPNHRPIERELFLAYFSRRKRALATPDGHLLSDMSLADREKYWREHGREHNQLQREIGELESWIYGEQPRQQMREHWDNIWNDEFWEDLQKSGVSVRAGSRIIDSLVPPARGRPITKRPLAPMALQFHVAGESWRKIADRLCHDQSCQEVIRQSVIGLKKVLHKYGIDLPQRPSRGV